VHYGSEIKYVANWEKGHQILTPNKPFITFYFPNKQTFKESDERQTDGSGFIKRHSSSTKQT